MLYAVGSAAPGQRLKTAQREGRLIVFVDESGISERPTRVRTWAPKGQTPVIQSHFNWTDAVRHQGDTGTRCGKRLGFAPIVLGTLAGSSALIGMGGPLILKNLLAMQ